jgi:hypothetical protein
MTLEKRKPIIFSCGSQRQKCRANVFLEVLGQGIDNLGRGGHIIVEWHVGGRVVERTAEQGLT